MEAPTAELTDISLAKPINEWDSGPAMIDLPRPDGSRSNLVFSSYIRSRDKVLHINHELDSVEYDTPTDGDFNLLLYVNENGHLTPLAAASISMEDDIPTVTMIQRVTARVKRDDVPPSEPDDLIKINAIYDRIPHPRADLLQGQNKVEWQLALLQQCEQVVKHQGYNRIRMRSGFSSKYAQVGHILPLAVQQYDYLVNGNENWTPIDQQGNPIVKNDIRAILSKVIKRVRDKAIKSLDEIKTLYPELSTPAAWEKPL
jgi:hypothetical protein